MTYYIYNSSFVGAGNAFPLAAGDVLQTLVNSVLASNNANGVNATGGVTIEVAGSVGGLNNGIYDTTTNGASSVIYIDRTGYVFSGVDGQGINITGVGHHTIVNSGAIQSVGNTGYGIETVGSGVIINQLGGYITASSAIFQNDNIAGDLNTIVNYGTIVGTGYSFVGTGSDKEVLNNQGLMVGGISMSTNAADLLYNTGTMDATISTSNVGYLVHDSAVVNAGLMYQSISKVTTEAMIEGGNGAGDYVYNTGTLAAILGSGANAAAILMGNGAGDYVYNSGVIYGNVVLGNGAGDSYLGANGKISGTIICGSGGDRINTGSDIEIVKAGTGNDTFNVGNGGETIIQETAAKQISNGFDVVSNFQSYVAASQQGTFLQLDPSFSGSTSFSAYNGGTLVQMSLGSGHYSYVDVLGASVAAVQAQTYFA
jgi:hypothetical protein